MPDPAAPYYPIIYVRGYAMTDDEQDETTADPFCGFNLGSTVFRATPDKTQPPKKFIFESPVLRLTTDYGYSDVYHNGLDILDADWDGTIARKAIVIYRYYDQSSTLLGDGKHRDITDFAKGLSDLILRVRTVLCNNPESGLTPDTFRCYLVAHSMGGLVCRAFLQNPELGDDTARRSVDKVFTYATPHNGIDMAGLNVPSWLTFDQMSNFNRDKMASYLDLVNVYKTTGRVDWLPESTFPSQRFFCMVGTNRSDYEAGKGVSRTFAGNGSDGLVRIENASVWGLDATGKLSAPCATAYAYRSHSGYFGIVNSEEAYQNLTRFLFGDLRVDIWVDVDSVRLPPEIEGKDVAALYQFELLTAPRGKRWYLSRRVAEEDSVACRTQQQLVDAEDTSGRRIFLSTVFLAMNSRVDMTDNSLSYGLTLGIRVPDYEVERRFWKDAHYEGAYLFQDTLVVRITAPQGEGQSWETTYGWQSDSPGHAPRTLEHRPLPDGRIEMTVPFDGENAPGIGGQLRFVVSTWNT